MNDKELVQRCKSGDKRVFNPLIEKYQHMGCSRMQEASLRASGVT
jgi:hypothetical protein